MRFFDWLFGRKPVKREVSPLTVEINVDSTKALADMELVEQRAKRVARAIGRVNKQAEKLARKGKPAQRKRRQ